MSKTTLEFYRDMDIVYISEDKEYCVPICGDNIPFHTIEEAREFIDNWYESAAHEELRYAVNFMDDEIREKLHSELAPCTDEEFLERYKQEHFEKYGEEFTF